MMASNVMITDVLDELNEENSRLINELVFSKQLIELFDNYRHLVKSLQTNCCCIENNELKTHLNQLEDNYLRLKTTKQKNVDKNLTKNLRPKKILKITESTDNLLIRDYIKTRNKLNNSYEKTANKSLSDREVLMKNKNKTWINKIDFTKQPKSLATNTKHLNSSSSSAVCIKQYNNNNNHNTSDDKKPIVIDNNNNNDNHNPDYNNITNNNNNIKSNDNYFKEETVDALDDSLMNKQSIDERRRRRRSKEKTKKVHKCHYSDCDKQFPYNCLLMSHLLLKHNDEQQLTEQQLMKMRQKPKRQIRRKNYRCDWIGCDKQFCHRFQLEGHQRTKHIGERPFKCRECMKSFGAAFYLRAHIKKCHTNQKFKCLYDNCDKVYLSSQALDDHHLRHQGLYLKKFKCNVDDCGKSYYKNWLLTQHKRTAHSDDRPYPCDWPGCDKRFKRPNYLSTHRDSHLNVRKYRCPVDGCDKVYATKHCLVSHKSSHTLPNVCTWPGCEARYGQKQKLTEHMNGHQGLKPYKCHFPDCDVSYRLNASLHRHLKTIHNYMKSYHRE